VPAPPEDDRKTAENLPDPELNPMTNTLLAQNMGRWAEVYFTTPPEKRDAAVQQLLRELRSGVKPTQNGISEEKITVSEQEILDAKQKFVELENTLAELQRKRVAENASASSESPELELMCPACLSKNKPGQRFCGLCGFTLSADRNNRSQALPPVNQPKSEPPAIERAGDDWTWLHERNRTALVVEQRKTTNWKYVVVVVFALMGCALGYLWWRGSLQTSSADEKERNTTHQDVDSVRPNAAEKASSQRVPVGKGATAEPERANSGKQQHEEAAAQTATDAERGSVPSNSAIESSIAEGGMQELETARRYLDGRGVPKDSSLAAQWLWKSIAKKNTEALITLSDMYAEGEGVAKSCDQARLLLSTAAQRGSQEAREKLKSIISACD
jgi:hypothetical protein